MTVDADMPDAIEEAVVLAESDTDGELERRRGADHRLGRDGRRRAEAAEEVTTPPPSRTRRDAVARPSGAAASGLRNPRRRYGLGAGTLALEAMVLLLAIQPIRVLGGDSAAGAIGRGGRLAVLAAALAGMMRRRWAWPAGTVLQVLLLVGGLLHWSLAALGLIFGAAWAYASYVRRTILG